MKKIEEGSYFLVDIKANYNPNLIVSDCIYQVKTYDVKAGMVYTVDGNQFYDYRVATVSKTKDWLERILDQQQDIMKYYLSVDKTLVKLTNHLKEMIEVEDENS